MRKKSSIDKIFLSITGALALGGLFVFTSASFGLFSRKGFSLENLLFDQVVLGFCLGVIIAFITVKWFPINLLQKYALAIFVGTIIISILVFIPGLGIEHGGARRWVNLGFTTFQPSEFLKLGTVIYLAALLPLFKDRISELRTSLAVFGGVLLVPAIILLSEPDTGTFAVLFVSALAMLLASGMKVRHLVLILVIGVLAVGALAVVRPYVGARIMTYLDPSQDPLGASYQLQKSLLAIGSGGIGGRGFGQSIQKFSSLPEPTGDSVFAVVGEEFGFIGGSIIIILFFLLGIRGLRIARRAPDMFSMLLVVGIVMLMVSQSFANIAAMLGIIPLTGVPLLFVSHGGTALLFAFLQVGIILSISKRKAE